MNILLVNQEYLQSEDLQKIQQSLDTSLFFAVTGQDALRLIQRNRMDFVVLDDRHEENDSLIHHIHTNPVKTRIILTNSGDKISDTSNLIYRFKGFPTVDDLIRVLKCISENRAMSTLRGISGKQQPDNYNVIQVITT